jgi:hypothetical protein
MKPGDPKYPDNGSSFDSDLRQVEEYYQALAQDEPPAMLDQAILNKARLAAETHPIRPWNFSWMHATATTAVLVIGLTLVLQQRSEVPAPVDFNRGTPATSDELNHEAETSLPAEIGSTRADDIDALGKTETTNEATRSIDEGSADTDLFDRLLVAPADAPAETAAENEPESLQVLRRERALKGTQAGLPEQELTQPMPTKHAGEETPGRQMDSQLKPEEQKEDRRTNLPVDEMRVSGAISAAAPAPSQSPASEPVLEEVDEDFSVVTGAAYRDSMKRSAGPTPEADDWIALILELKQHDEGSSWRRELEIFLDVYPDYPLPEELRNAIEPDPEGEDGGE